MSATKVIIDMIVDIDLGAGPFVQAAIRAMLHWRDGDYPPPARQARWLGLPSEEIFGGFGVSACAT